jgi:hypothetical protein
LLWFWNCIFYQQQHSLCLCHSLCCVLWRRGDVVGEVWCQVVVGLTNFVYCMYCMLLLSWRWALLLARRRCIHVYGSGMRYTPYALVHVYVHVYGSTPYALCTCLRTCVWLWDSVHTVRATYICTYMGTTVGFSTHRMRCVHVYVHMYT